MKRRKKEEKKREKKKKRKEKKIRNEMKKKRERVWERGIIKAKGESRFFDFFFNGHPHFHTIGILSYNFRMSVRTCP